MFVDRYGFLTAAIAAFFLYGMRDAPLLAAVAGVVVAFHSALSHKEISFGLCRPFPCIVITAGLGGARFVAQMPRWLGRPLDSGRTLRIAGALSLAAIALIGASARPFAARPTKSAIGSFWTEAGTSPDICGLGLYSPTHFPWGYTLGYSSLHRRVPVYLLGSEPELKQSIPAFNYAIAEADRIDDLPGFTAVRCLSDYCLYRRPASCQPSPDHEISQELTRLGE